MMMALTMLRLSLRERAGALGQSLRLLGGLGDLARSSGGAADELPFARETSHAFATKSQSGKGKGKQAAKEIPLYAREPLKDESDLSKYLSHDVSDKPWTPSSEREKR